LDGSRYRDLAEKFETSVLINSHFVSDMLKRGEFVEYRSPTRNRMTSSFISHVTY